MVDIENLGGDIPLGTGNNALGGDISEGVVAAVLYDLSDSTNEINDSVSNTQGVFTALSALSSGPVSRGTSGVDLIDFLDAWFCAGLGNKGNAMSGVMGIVNTKHQVPYDYPESCVR